jgi:hypothetical protein
MDSVLLLVSDTELEETKASICGLATRRNGRETQKECFVDEWEMKEEERKLESKSDG